MDPLAMRDGEEHIKEFLSNVEGEDVTRDGLQDTPHRVAKMYYEELLSGYGGDPKEVLKTFENEGGYKGMVVVRDVPLVSLCEHHMLPFTGRAHIGYLPSDRIVGLSKLARLVNIYARRLQVQEKLTQQIVDAIEEHLNPKGAIVVLEAEHMCMTVRGVQAPGTLTSTSAVTGVFNTNQEGEKEEFFRLIGRQT